jgi:hypothetical protein
MRERTGLAEISATSLAADTLRMLEQRASDGLPGNADDLVVILDPVSGRPARLMHAWIDGRLGLVDAPASPALGATAEASPVPAALPASDLTDPALDATPPSSTVPAHDATDSPGPRLELSPADLSKARAAMVGGSSLKNWLRSLPGSTVISFEPNPKRGASAVRYALYSEARSLGEYLSLNVRRCFQYPDLAYDFQRGYAKLAGVEPPVDVALVSDPPTLTRLPYPLHGPDPLHDLVTRLAPRNDGLSAALRFERLEGFSPSPPLAGGGLNATLAVEGYSTYRRLIQEPISLGDCDIQAVVYPADNEVGFIDAPPWPDGNGASLVGSVGLTEFRSVRALKNHGDNWEAWKAVIAAELDSVIGKKKAMVFKSAADFQAARAQYKERVEIVNLVTPAVVKHNANGEVLRLKWRLTAGDKKNNTASLFDGVTYSGAVDDAFVRFLACLTLGRTQGVRRTVDVKGAYFEGTQRPPDEGGRIIWAPVPPGWEEFGYPEFGTDGRRNWFHLCGNLPGLRNAGLEWQRVNDEFLLGQGFSQSIVDRRVFYRLRDDGKLFLICVYVDDYWTFCEDDAEWDVFYAKWSERFEPSASVTQAADDFCGVTYTQEPDGCLGARSLKLLLALKTMLEPHERPRSYETPMDPLVVPALAAPPSDSNPLLPDNISAARSILGLGMYVVRGTRPDGLFAGTALAPFVVVNLTRTVWMALLRWAHYLVDTRETRLLLRPIPEGTLPSFICCSDSSSINYTVPDDSVPTASMGGFSLFFPGSGSFLSECRAPKHLTDSSAGAELNMASWAGKAIIPVRMLQAELGLGPYGPTTVEIDASALLDTLAMDKISRKQRFQAARLAMIRQWKADGVVALKKERSSAMRADILSKAMAPAADFHRCARLLLTGSPD